MERRIVAELFVEDEKAIEMDKGTIDYAKEENKPTFVYIVKIDATIDSSTDTKMKVFSTYEKAKAYFDECVADEKANDHLMELDDKVVDDYENYFSVYQEGFWSEDRYEIEIIERAVH